MRILHVPSFLVGVGVGASSAAIAPRLCPAALEIATMCYRISDALMVKLARTREDLADLLAEAKARARRRLGPNLSVAA
jgi:hypothetical protein